MKRNAYAVIMAGGKGSRFWPLSRPQRPKQLLKLLSAKSLIRETVERVAPIFGEFLGKARPAATAIICGLVEPEMKIEIEVTARRSGATVSARSGRDGYPPGRV